MDRPRFIAGALGALLLLAACTGPTPTPRRPGKVFERGIASWYGPGFQGRPTASGERFDTRDMTAAHKTLPFGTVVEVRNLDNGLRVQVRINDRGPFIRGRIIDLSKAAAERIEMVGPGTAKVELALIEPPEARYYTVQLGAFQESHRAESLAAEVGASFQGARVERKNGWYRVRVGKFDDRCDAEDLRRRLRSRGFDALVVTL
ncbi:MAG: septal ring lytic transglycosylase RlpA family protein [Acidobacteriota bacterium]